MELLVKKVTVRQIVKEQFKNEQLRLKLRRNVNGLFECRERIHLLYPIHVPPGTLLSEKIIKDAHVQTLHGVNNGLVTSAILDTVRQGRKLLWERCNGCKRFQATAPIISQHTSWKYTAGQNVIIVIGLLEPNCSINWITWSKFTKFTLIIEL